MGKFFLEKFVNNIFVTYRDVVFFYHFHYAFQSSCSIANLFRVKTARIVKKSRVWYFWSAFLLFFSVFIDVRLGVILNENVFQDYLFNTVPHGCIPV